MIGAPAILIVTAGTAFFLASLAPAVVGGRLPGGRGGSSHQRILKGGPASRRRRARSGPRVVRGTRRRLEHDGDPPRPQRGDPVPVGSADKHHTRHQRCGSSGRHLKEEGTSPVVQRPIHSMEGSETPPPRRRRAIPGCEAPLSPLASRGASEPDARLVPRSNSRRTKCCDRVAGSQPGEMTSRWQAAKAQLSGAVQTTGSSSPGSASPIEWSPALVAAPIA